VRQREQGITLVGVVAVITILAVVTSLLVPAMLRGSRHQKILACEAHLLALHRAQAAAPPAGPKEFGRVFWTRLTRTTPPLVAADVLRCPFVEAPDAPACQYFGPGGDVAKLEAKEPIGCDLELSHSEDGKEGGNVLLKSGEVVTDHTGIWGSAVRSGKCRP
jgi:hypothetical protein